MLCRSMLWNLLNLIFTVSKASTFAGFVCFNILYIIFLVLIDFNMPFLTHLLFLCLYLLNFILFISRCLVFNSCTNLEINSLFSMGLAFMLLFTISEIFIFLTSVMKLFHETSSFVSIETYCCSILLFSFVDVIVKMAW